MNIKGKQTRRQFIQSAAGGMSLGFLGKSGITASEKEPAGKKDINLPRQIWVACVTNFGIAPKSQDDNVNKMLKRMNNVISFKPDIICLPEVFPDARLRNSPPISETAETVPGPITSRFSEFAKEHNCYIICPLHTKDKGAVYNSAVLIGRDGNIEGIYHKVNPTEYEMEKGIVPGPKQLPVFKTDFGTIGIQICFDANWTQNFYDLKNSGAEIIFFPSAFDGGRILNTLAWLCNYYIVSCTWRIPGKIIDITGEELYRVDYHQNWICAPINLEKELFHMDFQFKEIKAMQEKYGRNVEVKVYAEEGCVTIECRSPELTIKGLIEEYNLITYDDYIKRATVNQDKKRI